LLRALAISFLTLCLWTPLSVIAAPQESSTLPIIQYPYSTKIDSKPINSIDYPVILSVPRQINYQLRIKDKLRLNAIGFANTYQINDGHSAKEAFEFYRSKALKLGSEELFQCQSRDCGSSNTWANKIFNVLFLYGKNQSQHYYVGLFNNKKQPFIIILYAVERDNGRSYIHSEILKIRDINTLGKFKQRLLRAPSFFIVRFPSTEPVSPILDARLMRTLKKQAFAQTKKTLYLVGHRLTGYPNIQKALSLSLQMAQLVKDWLGKHQQGGDSVNSIIAAEVGNE